MARTLDRFWKKDFHAEAQIRKPSTKCIRMSFNRPLRDEQRFTAIPPGTESDRAIYQMPPPGQEEKKSEK